MMKTLFAVLVLTSAAHAQTYDPTTEVEFEGKVLGLLTTPSRQVNLLVKSSNGGSSLVLLGPQSFVSKQRMKIAIKDEIKVLGSKVFVEKRSAILASVVTKKGESMVLRDDAGKPLWPAEPEKIGAPQPKEVGGTVVLGGDVIDLSNTEGATLVVSTPEGDVQVELGQDWHLSNQRATYTMNELLAINGVYNNVGIPGRMIILPQSNRNGVLYLTPYWPLR